MLQFDLRADSLSTGLHSLVALLTDETGACTQVAQAFFTRFRQEQERDSVKIYYTIDDTSGKMEECVMTDSLVYADLDLSQLKEGAHTITFFITDGKGYESGTISAYFFKTKGTSGIEGVLIYNSDDDSRYVYTLGGVLVSKDGTKHLPKGIYIQGKRKIVVK